MANYELSITTIKILEMVYELNQKDYYPNMHGVLKLVNGKIDEETAKFINFKTFSTLTSIKGRQLANHVHQLVRYGYLSYKHNKVDDRMYLYITFKGESNLEDYKKHHKVNFKKREKMKAKPTIALIK